ncbi:MAG TPA: PIG-L family deacetylase [Chloroflexota bacterium]|nr:PIG-L family deacetylase [Chloroflexota bacterium]
MPESPNWCIMAVHAHPDDEVIGTGGTFLRYAEEGQRTVLVCATRGEEGEIHDPDLVEEEARPRLAEIRTRELQGAAQVLKIGSVELLDYRDSGMAGTPANEHPACFHQADLDEATARLVRLIRHHRPDVLISYNAFGGYGHPDHIKAHLITKAAFERAAEPTFAPTPELNPWQPVKLYETAIPREAMVRLREIMRQRNPNPQAEQDSNAWDPEKLGTPESEITTILDTRRYREARLAALRCHRTQIPEDSFFLQPFPEGVSSDLFFGSEHFVRVRSLVPAPDREDDLLAGLR